MKKMIIVTLILLVLIILVAYIITNNMNENSQTSTPDSSAYQGKIGEVISYIDNPTIAINDISIKYLGSTPWIPATKERVALSGTDKFEVSSKTGKSFQINWSSGTGLLPGPSYFMTDDSCYELNINILEGKRLENIRGKLVFNKSSNDKCGEWAKDLR